MVVSDSKEAVAKYWPWYRRHSLFVVITTQIVLVLGMVIAFILWGELTARESAFWIIVAAAGASLIVFNIIIFLIITAPFKVLSDALIHASDDDASAPYDTQATPTAAAPLVEVVHELAINQQKPDDSEGEEAPLDIGLALDETSTGIVLIKDGEIIYSNKSAPVKPNKEGGLDLELVFDSKDDIASWLKKCETKSLRSEKVWQRVPTRLAGEEDRRIFDIVASYENGATVDGVITLIDRTDEYQPEDDDLDFIAFAAHELRGPITVIRGYLDTLGDELNERFVDDEKELFERLVVSANRLSSYVNNILNAAKLDRRHLKVYLRETSVSDIYDTIKDDMELRAVSQNRALSVSFSDDLPTVAADTASIGEVMGNLIDNALKYSNEGGTVTVSAQKVAETVEVSIADQGIGMPSNVMGNLFHKFYRSHRSRETVAGTGIGLYICKAIVESHGGTISVRSVEGEGSTFSFTLPIYSTVAAKLKASHNTNEGFIETHEGWIKNHGNTRV